MVFSSLRVFICSQTSNFERMTQWLPEMASVLQSATLQFKVAIKSKTNKRITVFIQQLQGKFQKICTASATFLVESRIETKLYIYSTNIPIQRSQFAHTGYELVEVFTFHPSPLSCPHIAKWTTVIVVFCVCVAASKIKAQPLKWSQQISCSSSLCTSEQLFSS